MAKHVVGNWKTFTFHMAEMSDHERISKHVCENYLKDEPMNAALGWCDINAAEITQLVALALTHQISYYVTETGTDQGEPDSKIKPAMRIKLNKVDGATSVGLSNTRTRRQTYFDIYPSDLDLIHELPKQIVAVNLLMESTKEGFGFVGLPEAKSPNLSKIAKFVDKLHETTLYPYHAKMKFERYVDIFITSVDSKYRGNGIAEEMYRRMMIFLKEEGYQSVQSAFSSFGTRAIVNKLGFTALGRLYLLDHADNENGVKIFKKAKEGEFVAVMVKAL